LGDCSPDQPVVDEEDEVVDTAEIEVRADRYATRALVGNGTAPEVEAAVTYKQLAIRAAELERTTGVDASFTIWAWAARTRDYAKATMAVKALYRGTGARRLLRMHFDRHVDLDSANESDRALLRCLSGDPEHNEPSN
jgi:hypothetical protein